MYTTRYFPNYLQNKLQIINQTKEILVGKNTNNFNPEDCTLLKKEQKRIDNFSLSPCSSLLMGKGVKTFFVENLVYPEKNYLGYL